MEDPLQVLQISPRELLMSDNDDIAITLRRDLDGVAEITYATVHLNLVMQELFERADVKDLVGGGL